MGLTRTPDRPLGAEAAAKLRSAFSRTFNGSPDFDQLDSGEQRDLAQLLDAATPRESGEAVEGRRSPTLSLLSRRDRKKVEKLAERVLGRKVGSIENERADAAAEAELERLRLEAQRPPARNLRVEQGTIQLPKEWVTTFIEQNVLQPAHLALLVVLHSMIESQTTFGTPRASFENGGQTLVLDRHFGPFPAGRDDDHVFAGWTKQLEHLRQNEFFAVENRGREIRIRYGNRISRLVRDTNIRRRQAA